MLQRIFPKKRYSAATVPYGPVAPSIWSRSPSPPPGQGVRALQGSQICKLCQKGASFATTKKNRGARNAKISLLREWTFELSGGIMSHNLFFCIIKSDSDTTSCAVVSRPHTQLMLLLDKLHLFHSLWLLPIPATLLISIRISGFVPS